nr:hypothetical protein [Tanacetum cinerariifolium]
MDQKSSPKTSSWISIQIKAMQEELHQFDRLRVWELVDKPFGKTVIKLKCLWKNKKDEDNIVISNKTRLIAKGYAQEEGLQKEEVYVAQPDRFIDLDRLEKVYSLSTALYGLKQAPKSTKYQLADMFTKDLSQDRFKYLVRRLGMRCLTSAELEVLAKEIA